MEPTNKPAKPAHDPTKVSKSLAIALVVSAVFLLAAIGIAVWLFMRHGSSIASTVQDPDAATKSVKNVSLVAPQTLANYKKNDQSPLGSTRTYYYDTATNCGLAVVVSPLAAGKDAQQSLYAAAESMQVPGATVTADKQGESVDIKESGQDKTYTFESLKIKRSVNVPGVAYTDYEGAAMYKQFGPKVAAVIYGCPAGEWAAHKDGMAATAAAFTVTTER